MISESEFIKCEINDFNYDNIYDKSNKFDEEVSNKEILIKNSLFPKSELREIEQYFFTDKVLNDLTTALEYQDNILCLCTPAVADYFFYKRSKVVLLLDIDDRFNYLPGFKKFDMLKIDSNENLTSIIDLKEPLQLIFIDPPFFKINLIDIFNCIEYLSKGNKSIKLLFAFVIREERALLNVFKDYNLKLTKFKLEYKYVDATKWSNYGLYSNFETGKIKFCKNDKISTNKIKNINKSNNINKINNKNFKKKNI